MQALLRITAPEMAADVIGKKVPIVALQICAPPSPAASAEADIRSASSDLDIPGDHNRQGLPEVGV